MSSHEFDPQTTRMVNLKELGELIRTRRKEEQLTQSQAAKKIGISAATLSRLERYDEDSPASDVATLSKVTRWLGVPLADYMASELEADIQQRIRQHRGNTPALVEAHLRADRRLDTKTAAALSELFRAAYDQFTKLSTPTNKSDNSVGDAPSELTPK